MPNVGVRLAGDWPKALHPTSSVALSAASFSLQAVIAYRRICTPPKEGDAFLPLILRVAQITIGLLFGLRLSQAGHVKPSHGECCAICPSHVQHPTLGH